MKDRIHASTNDKRDPTRYWTFFGNETTIAAFLAGVDHRQSTYPLFGDVITISIWHHEENEDDMEYLITWAYNGEQLDLSNLKEKKIDCDP